MHLVYLRVASAKRVRHDRQVTICSFVWVVDWPLFEYSEEFERYIAAHHPFTMPNEEDLELLATDPHKCHAQSYDIVLNGYELGGGSIRIHQRSVQEAMFKALGFTKESAKRTIWLVHGCFRLWFSLTRWLSTWIRSFCNVISW